ncbi:hypothetical protein SLU01_19220 [Sporosarcina luteola]|uniref:Cthe-2314-like HEPN domain-containing protein n=1 Tax=Sporosarcina luteola TaxID=582850 RepID=A0A511Z846_9BACL|nr:hypothetical protein [Sporosarcina luteola]GEN83610.1 hypothetical protein SLU01_19220 [Sporosarcina luteola]
MNEKLQVLKGHLQSRLEREKDYLEAINFKDALPKFELFPADYLSFAEQELELVLKDPSNVRVKINCILHLKRALNCQLDIFFHIFGFTKYVQKNNLGLDKQLSFLKDTGIIKSRVINRFNKIRNKIEHQYRIPDIDDVEVYFDLISILNAQIENTIYISGTVSGMEDGILDDTDSIKIEFNRKPVPEISFKVTNDKGEYEDNADLETNREYFTKLFKVFIYLTKKESSSFSERFIEEL